MKYPLTIPEPKRQQITRIMIPNNQTITRIGLIITHPDQHPPLQLLTLFLRKLAGHKNPF
jgi:hypothetical protein